MFGMISHEEVAYIKKQYPEGTRIVLNWMEDPFSPVAPGTCGTVQFVDDIGQIHMKWDNGRTLALIPGVDSFQMVAESVREIVKE